MDDLSKYFTEQEITEITGHQYYPRSWRGTGHTRDVFRALFKTKEFQKEVALKVTRKATDDSSVCTLINLSKMRHPNVQEIEYIKHFNDHPNIASIWNVFTIKDDLGSVRHITVEEWMDGKTLEEYVQEKGHLKDLETLKMAAATLRALAYMHHKSNDPWIMRDIKPSNIINDNELYIKITDMQNGKYRSQIKPQLLPTRGGTQYTHPKILDSFMKGKESRCDIYTDVYAWGSTLFYSISGKNPFNYTLERHDSGIPVHLGGRIIHASVMLDNKPVEGITRDEHNEKLAKVVKEIPDYFRPIVFDCMYWGDKPYSVKDIVRDLREIDQENMFKESWHSIDSFIRNGKF